MTPGSELLDVVQLAAATALGCQRSEIGADTILAPPDMFRGTCRHCPAMGIWRYLKYVTWMFKNDPKNWMSRYISVTSTDVISVGWWMMPYDYRSSTKSWFGWESLLCRACHFECSPTKLIIKLIIKLAPDCISVSQDWPTYFLGDMIVLVKSLILFLVSLEQFFRIWIREFWPHQNRDDISPVAGQVGLGFWRCGVSQVDYLDDLLTKTSHESRWEKRMGGLKWGCLFSIFICYN
jgi:hypothetical protein